MTKPRPKLTLDGLKAAMEPPNNCKVKAFLDTLDAESREVLEAGLKLTKEEFPASAVIDFLLASGFDADAVPSTGAIQDHRRGARPCRCRG